MNKTLPLSSWSLLSTEEGRTSKTGYQILIGEGKKGAFGTWELQAGGTNKSSPGDEEGEEWSRRKSTEVGAVTCIVRRCTGNRKQPQEGRGDWFYRRGLVGGRRVCIFKVLVSGLGDLCSEKSSLFRYAILTKTDFNKYVQSCNQHHNQPIEHLHHPTRFPCALLDATLPLQPAPPPRACQYSFAFSTLS